MANSRIGYWMNKRGQAEVIGGLILIGVLVFGGIITQDVLEDNRYVIDLNTNTTYDLIKCNIKNIDKTNLKMVDDIDGIDTSIYKLAECSK